MSNAMDSIFTTCQSSESLTTLHCVADHLEAIQIRDQVDVNTWLLIFASALIFFMQAGFAMLCAGSVRAKNVGNTMLKNLLDACGAALGFFSIGFAFAFGGEGEGTTFIGTTKFFMIGVESYSFWLFQFGKFATHVDDKLHEYFR
jgi:ammonia channel protein AmtB